MKRFKEQFYLFGPGKTFSQGKCPPLRSAWDAGLSDQEVHNEKDP